MRSAVGSDWRRQAILAVAVAATLAPTAAAARPLPGGVEAASPAVATPESRLIASLAAPGRLAVRDPGVRTRVFSVPDGCAPLAVAPGTVFLCDHLTGIRALEFASGKPSSVEVGQVTRSKEDYEFFRLRAAGTHWLEGEVAITSDTSPSATVVPVIVSRASGRVIDLSGRFSEVARSWGSRRYVALSSPRPDRRLCGPVRRAIVRRGRDYRRLVKVGRWTLREGLRERGQLLQRCGSRRAIRFGRSADPVLGREVVAWFDRRLIRLRSLRTGRTRSFTWYRRGSSRSQTTLAFSSTRLVVSQRLAAQRFRVHTIPLR